MNQHSSSRVVFVGSFDPFHEGHRNVVDRALKLFDEVVVGVSINEQKEYASSLEERVKRIEEIYKDEARVMVEANEGLTIDFAHRHKAKCIIKGVRNVEDFTSEQEQALWNKKHGGVETLLLVADEGLENISSTLIREND